MKKSLFIALLLFFTGVAQDVKATHNRGGEITYKRIGPFTKVVNSVTVSVYNYSITVTKYHNYGVNIANRCVDTVYFGDGQKGVAPRGNGQVCGDCGGIGCGQVISAPGFSLLLSIYTITYTYPGPGSYLIRSSDPNRNPDIVNIPNSMNVPFYLESLLIINSFTGANSSPACNSELVSTTTLNTCFFHYPNATDPDDDSLSYELPPNTFAYSYPDAGTGGYYGINSKDGTLAWCNPQKSGIYALHYIVKEWRKNTSGKYELCGYILREMEVTAVPGIVGLTEQNNHSGILLFPNPMVDHFIIKCPGEINSDLSFEITTIQGSAMHAGTFNNEKKQYDVDCSSLAPGTYFIKIHSNENTVVKKIIKL